MPISNNNCANIFIDMQIDINIDIDIKIVINLREGIILHRISFEQGLSQTTCATRRRAKKNQRNLPRKIRSGTDLPSEAYEKNCLSRTVASEAYEKFRFDTGVPSEAYEKIVLQEL